MQIIFNLLLSICLRANPASLKSDYVIVMKENTSQVDLDKYISEIKSLIDKNIKVHRRSGFNEIKLKEKYSGKLFSGFSGHFPNFILEKIAKNENVECISSNSIYQSNLNLPDGIEANATWGLARITSKTKLNNNQFNYKYDYDPNGGEGINAYVIDSGIHIQHPEFEGRAKWGINLVNDINDDENGHGTHVAGIIGGKTYGVSKKVSPIAVKVMDKNGSGNISTIIKGLEWVYNDIKSKNKKSVINMSIGGTYNRCLNLVTERLVKVVPIAVAAGNDFKNSCEYSPASSKGVITVASSNINDALSSYSNYGYCTKIIAPGENIKSTWNDGSTKTISGTSMASPHVAGMISNLLSPSKDSTFEDIYEKLFSYALKDQILGATQTNTPNLLLHYSF